MAHLDLDFLMARHQSFLPLCSPECLLMASSACTHNILFTHLSLINYELFESSDSILIPLDLHIIPRKILFQCLDFSERSSQDVDE